MYLSSKFMFTAYNKFCEQQKSKLISKIYFNLMGKIYRDSEIYLLQIIPIKYILHFNIDI